MRDTACRKYRNKKIRTEEGTFDSKKEFQRWQILKEREAKGDICCLGRQVKMELIPVQRINNKVIERACYYIADFIYMDGSEMIIEDVKSPITRKKPEYVIKRKLVLQRYGVPIREI